MMYIRNNFQRSLIIFLACAMLCTACAGGAKATTMHLTKSEGGVDVRDDGGKAVELLEQLGLYSGYQVDTGEKSYAWIDLDSVKLTKMDVDSEIEIQKDGKQLEIEVKSGGLFFNVTEPLGEDETMDIRTSTMTVGIRGTCGWVTAEDENHMWVSLLDGKVSCSVMDSAGSGTGAASVSESASDSASGSSAAFISDTVSAGERAELVYDENGGSSITITELTMEDIPDFVLEEIRDTEDEALLEMLEELERKAAEEETGSEEQTEQESGLPAGFGSKSMGFSSGAGGWGTDIVLNQDGTFAGSYHDSEMGLSGEGYIATVYISSFEGQFEDITKLNDYSYSMRLSRIDMENEPGEEWIDEEGLRYVAAEPYGFDGGTEFVLYTPDAPLSELSEEFQSWRQDDRSRTEGTLEHYGLYNKEMGYGFFTYE